MFDALPSYLGGKRAMLGQIFREVAQHVDPSRWKQSTFVDGFVGGGSVSIYAKAQFRSVLGNDLANRSAMIARGILENNGTVLSRSDAILLLEGVDSPTNYAATQKDWFIPETAEFLDRCVAYADTIADPTKAELVRNVAWRVIMGSRPLDGAFTSRRIVDRAMAGELKTENLVQARYAFRRPDIRDIERISASFARGIFRGQYRFTQEDALEASADWEADIVYLDPPYAGDRSYEQFYRIADSVMLQAEVPNTGSSPFTDKRTAEASISRLIGNIARAGTRFVLMNNSDEAISRGRMLEIVGEHFQASEVPVKHHHHSASSRGFDGEASGASEVFIIGVRP